VNGVEDELSKEILSLWRESLGQNGREDGGLPYTLEDDLHQIRLKYQSETPRMAMNDWAEARGVPYEYACALDAYLKWG
jgi:hypothetical protein